MRAQFLPPDESLASLPAADLQKALNIRTYSGYKAPLGQFKGRNFLFDALLAKMVTNFPFEDQCSADYYFDLFTCLKHHVGEFNRVVEVGVYMGGASVIIGGCAQALNFDVDLVDPNAQFLQFAYERIRRSFPEAARRVRLFQGTLPAYVQQVLISEPDARAVVQHDGPHAFETVVKDLASLYYASNQIQGIAVQDTNLRGLPKSMSFVDLAICAVFGYDVNHLKIGQVVQANDSLRVNPNQYQGNYVMPGMHEGMYIPMAANEFFYPHPLMALEDFVYDIPLLAYSRPGLDEAPQSANVA